MPDILEAAPLLTEHLPATTVCELFSAYAASDPDRPAFAFLDAKGAEERRLTYGDLYQGCTKMAGALSQRLPQERTILLALSDQHDFVLAFGGALFAGLVPAPMAPLRHKRNAPGLERCLKVLQNDGGDALLVDDGSQDWVRRVLATEGLGHVQVLTPAELARHASPLAPTKPVDPNDVAYLQYTSGSTSAPKGVVLRHHNVIANLRHMTEVLAVPDTLRVAGWLPLHHDMGLVGDIFLVLFGGGFAALLPPAAFLARPGLWLEAISRYKANTAAAPTFALDHCTRSAEVAADCDLSTWERFCVGSETVSVPILRAFVKRFAPLGLRENTIRPVYGLAEATLLASGGHRGLSELIPAIKSHRTGADSSRELIPFPLHPGVEITICAPTTQAPCADGQIGEIWIGGASVAAGYLGDSLSSSPHGRLATGDLGFIEHGHLYITGRKKEIVILRGRNLAAEDIESALAQPADGQAMAVASRLGDAGEELWIFHEVHRHLERPAAIAHAAALSARLVEAFEVQPHRIVLLPTGFLPRTANNKIARGECLLRYQSGDLRVLYDLGREDLLQAQTSVDVDPVVVVGMACRFPGAEDPEHFWHNLAEGVDSISEVPEDRWEKDLFYDQAPATPGKMNTKWAGFIERIAHFDADLFGISAVEAPEIDPQQRLLLETSWRLLENAGWKASQLRGSETGVFIGLSTNDYLYSKVKLSVGMETFNAYSGLGNANSVAANRLSYVYDLHGPSMAVDTACSSSLTAFHLGVQAIRSGECDQAIVGGVNAILSPGPTITLSQFGMMAPDGRCKAFDANANGYVRAEGCGLVMLKRRSAAVRDGDTILAHVAASVTGQDGASSGITHPNGDAQERLIARAQRLAGAAGQAVSYVEAHGTGTHAGDPVEVHAILNRYGEQRTDPCWLGSVKANIGHLEAAAGIASVIKVLLMLRHKAIPPQIQISTLNPALGLAGTAVAVPLARQDWQSDGPRVAAISSFGFGGALAHVILEEAPPAAPPAPVVGSPTTEPHPLVLSAPTEPALRAHAKALAEWLQGFPPIAYHDLCRTLALTRSDHRYRRATVALSRKNATDQLLAWLESERPLTPMNAQVKTAFLFTGQGEHYLYMGKELYQRFPQFRQDFDRCASAVDRADHPFTLAELAFDISDTTCWQDQYLQPILFAVQYSLARLLESVGVKPEVMIGHSLGEYALASLAGCMTPEDAMRLLYRRGQLTASLTAGTFMVLIYAPRAVVEAEIDLQKVQIAAVNSPQKTVISGDGQEAERVRKLFADRGVESYFLKTNVAFHSHVLDPILDDFRDSLRRVEFRAPAAGRRWISTVTGLAKTDAPDAEYWVRHMRETVLFAPALQQIADEPLDFIEIGPGASSLAGARETLKRKDALYLRTLNHKKGDRTESAFFLDSLCRLYERGVAINWQPVTCGQARPTEVPGLTFAQKRYWIKGAGPDAFNAFLTPQAGRPLADPAERWHYTLDWHDVGPVPALPAASKPLNWLIVGPPSPLTQALIDASQNRGEGVFWINCAPHAKGSGMRSKADAHMPPGQSRADWGRTLARIFKLKSKSATLPWRVLLPCAPPLSANADLARLTQSQSESFLTLVPLLQALYDQAYVHPLWLLTEDAQAVQHPAPANPAAASVWGFGKTLLLENPVWRGGMIDLSSAESPQAQAAQVIAKVLSPEFESCVALRDGHLYAQQITPAPLKKPAEPLRYRGDGAYIITGGLGGLGLETAKWVVEKGARHLILLSRRGLPDDASAPEDQQTLAKLADLRSLGATVEVLALDVRNSAALAGLFAQLDSDGVTVRGVVHAAGENWFGKVLELDPARFVETLKTKITATQALHELTRHRDLDCFILFSSVSAVWGSVNLSHYTAANQFMDMLSLVRAQAGLPSLCINWGPWDEVGMSAKAAEKEMMHKLGLELIPPPQALAAMEAAAVARRPLSMITNSDWQAFQVFIDFCPQPSAFARVVSSARDRAALTMTDRLQAIQDATDAEALAIIDKAVRLELKSVSLIESADRIDGTQRFNFMGMDSLMALSFAAALETYFQFDIPSTLTYNYPTLNAVSAYIYTQLRGAPPPTGEAEPVAPPANWLRPLNDPAPATVLCLPFAGSGASVYQSLAAALNGRMQVVALQLPGREDLGHLPAHHAMEPLVSQILEMWPDLDGPCYLYGHSMGAAIASEVVRRLEQLAKPPLAGLILSGCNPLLGPVPQPIHDLPDQEFLAAILDKYESQDDRATRAEGLARSLDLLRADLTLFETFRPSPGQLRTAIGAIFASDDRLVDHDAMQRWGEVTTGGFAFAQIPGGHQIVKEDPNGLAEALQSMVSRLSQLGQGKHNV